MASPKQKKYTSIRESIELIAKDALNPRTLSREDRRLCVEFLRYELRYPTSKIAKFLQVSEPTINTDLHAIHIGVGKALDHGEVTAELVGQLLGQLRTNYNMALEKRDVSGANKATQLLQELAQDLGHVSKADDTVNHKGLDLLALAVGAAAKKE